MYENHKNCLRKNRVQIVSDLEPKGTVLDTLYEDGILTENDLELVSSAKTRKERCQLLLSILPTRGPVAYGSFQKALGAGQYEFLADQLSREKHETPSKTDAGSTQDLSYKTMEYTETCQKCCLFLEKVKNEDRRLNSSLLRVIKGHCCLLLDNIEPKDVVDQLFQDHVISADDIDAVMGSDTRRNRCETLFKILLNLQGNAVVESLKLSLKKKYSYIIEQATNDFNYSQQMEPTSKPQTAADTRKEKYKASSWENIKYDEQGNLSDSIRNATDLKSPVGVNEIVKDEFKTYTNNTVGGKHGSGADTVDGAAPLRQHLPRISGAQREEEYFTENSLDSLVGNAACPKVKPVEGTYEAQNIKCIHQKGKQKKMSKVNDSQTLRDISYQNHHGKNGNREIVPKQVTAIHSQKPGRRLTVAFNYLSTLINQGEFEKFEETSAKLQAQFPRNYDLMCIIGYLLTSRDLFQTNFDSAKSRIDSTMALVPKTSNPRYFMLELFTAKTRMYITRKKLEKLQTTLDEAMMILETDPVGCTGRAAGWLYINDARNKTAQLSCLNLRSPNACHVYERLFEAAKTSFQRSMTNFKKDGGKDGPFGFGYALCRLVILLLRCGDNGLTMNSLTPSADDIYSAGQYLHHLEDSDLVISKILDMHFRLAKCDYQFRRGNFVRALEHAQIAHDLASELRLFEFTEHAYNRVCFLKSKSPIFSEADELSEEETQRILFEEPSDSEYDT